jgi:hypothetical protein
MNEEVITQTYRRREGKDKKKKKKERRTKEVKDEVRNEGDSVASDGGRECEVMSAGCGTASRDPVPWCLGSFSYPALKSAHSLTLLSKVWKMHLYEKCSGFHYISPPIMK